MNTILSGEPVPASAPSGAQVPAAPEGKLSRLRDRLFARVDIASIVVFRVGFGAIMLWEVWRYFSHGWIAEYFIEPKFHFTYYGFDWVRPWSGNGMYIHFLLLGVLAAFIMAGLFYRLSAILFFLGFTYVFLLEQARYLNHFYLICWISFVLIVLPAHRAFSLDSLRRSDIRSATAPAWALWLLRAQVGIPYFYAGLAKLNGDWLKGEPMRAWLSERMDFPLIGRWFTEEWMVYFVAYSGMLFDLSVVGLLLYRRTRILGYLAAVVFHLLNAGLFHIGIFPWMMIVATTVFLSPDWPQRVLNWGKKPRRSETLLSSSSPRVSVGTQRLVVTLLAAYLAVNLLVPLRHFVYPGNVSWTEEGHRFAWHMKLRSKGGSTNFIANDESTGRKWQVNARDYLTDWQADSMETKPYLILAFSHYLSRELSRQAEGRVGIRAQAYASLNDRREQLLIDPNVDLTKVRPGLPPASWIIPLTTPLYVP